MSEHTSSTWVDKTRGERQDSYQRDQNYYSSKAQFKNAHTSLGWPAHVLHIVAMLTPVIAGEFIEAPATYKKVVRLTSVGVAAGFEGLHAYREEQRRKETEARLEDCRNSKGVG
jgi:hypothetical protein